MYQLYKMIKIIADKFNALDNFAKFAIGGLVVGSTISATAGAVGAMIAIGYTLSVATEKGKKLDDYAQKNYNHIFTIDELLDGSTGKPNLLLQMAQSDNTDEEKEKFYDKYLSEHLHLKKIKK